MRRGYIALGAALAVAAVVWGAPASGTSPASPVSDVIFPPQVIPLRFSHHLHLARGATCDSCHADARTSTSSLDNLVPTEAACRPCHAIERDKPEKQVAAGQGPARCDACHTQYAPGRGGVARVRIPVPNIKFSHKAHLARNTSCTPCHGDFQAAKVDLATRDHLPKMATCLTCHDGTRAAAACTTCHLTGTGAQMKTQYASGSLKPSGALRGAAHTMQFARNHSAVAASNPDYCATCHKKDFCTDCHNGAVKPMDFHVGDYVTMHAMDARRNQPNCSTCHRTQTFCVGCHSRSGVSADKRGSEFEGPLSGIAGRRYHPLGWVEVTGAGSPLTGPGTRSAMHHSFEAQRNIRQCASCHREQFCTRCHTAQQGGFRINPHPSNWSGSRRCRSLAARTPRMCTRCHTDPTERGCDWRSSLR